MAPKDGWCRGCPGGLGLTSLPHAILDGMLGSPAIWRASPAGPRLGIDTAELRARLADLPAALARDVIALAHAVEPVALAAFREAEHGDP